MTITKNRLTAVEEIATTEVADSTMRVRKRSGRLEPVDVNKIVNAVARAAEGLLGVDPLTVSTRTIAALTDGATSRQLDELSIRTAAGLIVEEPNYSKLAARMLATYIDKEVRNQNLPWFSEAISSAHQLGLISDETNDFVHAHAPTLNAAIDSQRNRNFEFFGLRTVYDRYLLRHPESRLVIETPQYFFMRVACGLSTDPEEAVGFYDLISSLAYMPSSATLFNSGTSHPQMSSCYLLESPEDSLEGIYKRYTDVARLSKFAGGIGVAWHRIRSKGSLIRGTNGLSSGIVPWLKTLDSSVAAVNQGGRRKGAACVYLETWHADVEQFLELRDNTGDYARRTHHINLANWVPDLFMERVHQGQHWSLFDPKKVPELIDTYGDEFRSLYEQAENEELYERQIPARQLYTRMLRTLAETGNGWMTFKDACNIKCNQTGPGSDGGSNSRDRVVHLSNLCTEIVEVTNFEETAVCNLGSINLGAFVLSGASAKSVTYPNLRVVAPTDSAPLNSAPLRVVAPSHSPSLRMVAPTAQRTDAQQTDSDLTAASQMRDFQVTAASPIADSDLTAASQMRDFQVTDSQLELDAGFDFDRLGEVVRTVVKFLDRVIDINYYPTDEAQASNRRWRPVGLGLMGLQDVFFKLGLPFDSPRARELSTRISEQIYFHALWSSSELAEAHGAHPAFPETRAAAGDLQFDLWGVKPKNPQRWEELRQRIALHGLRNSLLVAIAPTATIAAISGCYECTEPQVSNLFKRETLSGEFMQINKYLVADLKARGLWDAKMIADVKKSEGSVQNIERIPENLRTIYRTAWEIPQKSLIEMAADRGAFIDQSQSLNLFMESPTIGKLSSMYMYAWNKGLKTTYYLRSRPATRIAQTTTVNTASGVSNNGNGSDAASTGSGDHTTAWRSSEQVACMLENPETCEACD